MKYALTLIIIIAGIAGLTIFSGTDNSAEEHHGGEVVKEYE